MRRRRFRSPPPRPSGFYLQYLNDLIAKRRASGKPLAELHDDEYWNERRRNEALKDQPLRKVAWGAEPFAHAECMRCIDSISIGPQFGMILAEFSPCCRSATS
jgi:hypothetical protein